MAELASPGGSTESMKITAETIMAGEVVPASLVEIQPILRAANAVDHMNGRVSYLCRWYAFQRADRLDPTSSGRGVRQFKTVLLQILRDSVVLNQEMHPSDAREMEGFYHNYYKRFIQAFQKADKKDERTQLTKAYQTSAVLFEVLMAVNMLRLDDLDPLSLQKYWDGLEPSEQKADGHGLIDASTSDSDGLTDAFGDRSMAPNTTSPFALRSILEKDKLNGTNYTDWVRNLRIVLRADKKETVLDTPIPEEPAENATAALKNAYKKACDESLEVSCLMLACMEPDLQKQFDDQEAYDMIVALKDMFQTQARTERFNVAKAFVECKLAEGAAVGPHVIKMVGYSQTLEKLGFPLGQELATDFILASLPSSYGHFISNYHMHGVEKGLNELCGMLKTAECDIKKCAGHGHVMAVHNKPSFKKKGTSWQKKKGKAKDTIQRPKPQPKQKAGPAEDTECFFCHEHGHWKRNCSKYQASLKKGGSKSTSNSGANKD